MIISTKVGGKWYLQLAHQHSGYYLGRYVTRVDKEPKVFSILLTRMKHTQKACSRYASRDLSKSMMMTMLMVMVVVVIVRDVQC